MNRWIVVSDIHDRIENIDWMLKYVSELPNSRLLFLGDFCAPFAAKRLFQFPGPIDVVWGNVDGDQYSIMVLAYDLYNNRPRIHGNFADLVVEGHRICMIHDHRISQLIAETEHFEAVFYGNDHKWRHDKIGKTLILNPGTLGGISHPPSFAIIDPSNWGVEKIIINL